ncbi:NAD(P)-dependent oxidoreductase [Paenibacillus harenae]|uniref:NAD(P)-dependent oxidoreductase n=1 Tax=Paenibacillus harenae TaxID=306543 RepID=UPI0027926228|nr:NAD(P)-binding oxidoreductase [Paenibacillus harenae]MDQ0059970.1 putative NADH-flavin reductase [Paenibacillus harenae]
MKLIIFGASGRTGRHIVDSALQSGHTVTAFVRTRSSIHQSHPNLVVVEGDVLRTEDIDRAIRHHDMVISSLGITSTSSKTICSEGIKRILTAMAQNKVQRLIAISEASVSESLSKLPMLGRAVIRLLLDKQAIEDKELMEQYMKNSGLDWTIVRPPFLTNGPLKGKYRAGESADLKLTSTISRADLADFIVKQVNSRQSIKKAVAIHY